MHRCAGPPRCFFAIPILCVIDCAGSRSAPADLSRAQGMSPNYVWLSKCTAGSCNHVEGSVDRRAVRRHLDAAAAWYRMTTRDTAAAANQLAIAACRRAQVATEPDLDEQPMNMKPPVRIMFGKTDHVAPADSGRLSAQHLRAHWPPSDADTTQDGSLPACTSPTSFLIASRRVDTVIDSMTRGPAMRSASSVWCDQTPL